MAVIGKWRTGEGFSTKRILLATAALFTIAATGFAISTANRFIHKKEGTKIRLEDSAQPRQSPYFTIPKPLTEPLSIAPKQTPVQPPKTATSNSTEQKTETKKPRRVWCIYDQEKQTIMSYIESGTKPTQGKELGNATFLPLDDFESVKPLAVACHKDGTVWIVGKKSIYTGKIAPLESSKGNYAVKDTLEVSHTNIPEEYRPPGTQVIAANIWWPSKEQLPVVATVTNNGFLQIFRPPRNEPTISDKIIFELRKIDWPNGIAGVVVGIINTNEFTVIPFGNQNAGITELYYLRVIGNSYANAQGAKPHTLSVKSVAPNAKNIFAASQIIYSEERGGWVSTLHVMLNDGSTIEIPMNVKPRNVE